MEDYRAAADVPVAGIDCEHRVVIAASSPADATRRARPRPHVAQWTHPASVHPDRIRIYATSVRGPSVELGRSSNSGQWLQQIGIGLLVGSIPPTLFFLAACELGDAHLARTALDVHHVFTLTLPALGSILLLSLHEELVFRGYLMQLISQKAGRAVAALITGILFGLVHSANSAANPQGLLFTAIGGVLLAWLIMRNGSLWMAGGYHAGWNATASLALGLSVSGTTTPGSWITTTLSGPRWISGGPYGFEGSIIAGLVEPVVLGSLVWLAPRLPSHPELRSYFQKQSANGMPGES